MKNSHDNIRVGSVTLVYSVMQRGWLYPGLPPVKNPLKAQRLAEELNKRRVAA